MELFGVDGDDDGVVAVSAFGEVAAVGKEEIVARRSADGDVDVFVASASQGVVVVGAVDRLESDGKVGGELGLAVKGVAVHTIGRYVDKERAGWGQLRIVEVVRLVVVAPTVRPDEIFRVVQLVDTLAAVVVLPGVPLSITAREHHVVAIAAEHGVGAIARDQRVTAGTALPVVGAPAADQRVLRPVAGQRISQGVAVDDRVPVDLDVDVLDPDQDIGLI